MMLKDYDLNFATILGLLGLGAIAIKLFPHIAKEKNQELKDKLSIKEFSDFKSHLHEQERREKEYEEEIEKRKEEERNLRETNLKTWVEGTIKSFISEAVSALNSNFNKAVSKLDTKIEDIRKESVKRHETITNLFDEYKKYNHGRIEQMQATINACMETLKRAEKLDETVDKSQRLLSDLTILIKEIKHEQK